MIEGIPDGWELVRIGPVCYGEWRLMESGSVKQWDVMEPSLGWAVVLRKIEKPKRYRPFANAAEFEPHRDRWIEYTSPNHGDCSFYRATAFHNERVWLGPDNSGKTYREAFHCLRFDDGTPFGIEVTE